MSHKIKREIGLPGSLVLKKSASAGITTVELDPEWELCKRRLEAFTESVLSRFNPHLLKAKGCIALFGCGSERYNKDAMKYWLVTKYQDRLSEDSLDVRSIANEAYRQMVLMICEESGIPELMK